LRPNGLNVLGTSALVLLAGDPLIITDAGAWLSFGATAGIVMAAGHSADARRDGRAARAVLGRLGAAAAALMAATVAAELAVLPISASLFARVGVAGLALNFVAIPMMAIVQMAGLAALVFAACTPLARALALITHGAATALLESAGLVDVLPWLSWRSPPPAHPVVAVYYLICVGWLMSRRHRRFKRAMTMSVVAMAMLIAFAPTTVLAGPASGWLRLTMIDVGQGDALLLQCPGGHAALIDAGPAGGGFDAGDRVVARALWALGVRRLDTLVFTHADLDHVGGALSVATIFEPAEVWEGVPVPPDPKRAALHAWARARGVPWRQLQRGDRLEVGPVDLTVLSPPLPDWERQRVRNDDSIVLRLRYGEADVVLTGDVEADVEGTLGLSEPRGAVRVLKVAHHGSRTSTSEALVDEFRPALALVSVGRGNLFQHPSPEVIARLRSAGARLFRTDRDGAVIVETDGQRVDVRSMAGRTWRIDAARGPS
jgi:competence protein ComEC